MNKDLLTCRKEIDDIDNQIITLFTQRMTVCENIAAIKAKENLPINDPKREAEKILALIQKTPKRLQRYIPKLWFVIMDSSKDYQKTYLPTTKPAVIEPEKKKKIRVINGPNLNLLGIREPEIYGYQSYCDLVDFIKAIGETEELIIDCFQSNHEGEIIDCIQAARLKYDGILINPGGFSHTGIAIMDALSAVQLPTVEVHLSDIAHREPFRQHSYTAQACLKTFSGMGFDSYRQGLVFLKNHLLSTKK